MRWTSSPLDHLLGDLRVVEWTGPRGAYAGRLLADLGADVIRLVPPSGDPLAGFGPAVTCRGGGTVSGLELFANLNKRSVTVDPATEQGRVVMAALLDTADVFIDGSEVAERPAYGWTTAALTAAHPRLVHVSVLPFGCGGPYEDYLGGDLVQMAAGGLLSLAGYPDVAPTLAHGGQSDLAVSIFAAVAAVLGVLSQRADGKGTSVDLSAQDVIVGALEDAVARADLLGEVRRRQGDTPREAGTGIFPCADGYVAMVAGRLGTAAAWKALTAWLAEEEVHGAAAMCLPPWDEFAYRQSDEAVAYFEDVMRRFARPRSKAQLYEEGQRRRIAVAPVNTIDDVLADDQLADRGFFRTVHDDRVGRAVTYPGTPYRVDGLPGTLASPAPTPGQHTDEVLVELGVTSTAGGRSTAGDRS